MTPLSPLLRSAWAVIWLLHALGAAALFWGMPQGFPPGHLKFFANTVVPLGVFAVSMLGVYSVQRQKSVTLASLAAFPLVFWMLLGGVWYQLCPLSMKRYVLFAAPGLLVLLVLWIQTKRAKSGMTVLSLFATLLAASGGTVWAFAQRGGPPSTQPLSQGVMMVLSERGALVEPGTVKKPFVLAPNTAQLSFRRAGVNVDVFPLLTFQSRSPDKCWSILAPKGTNAGKLELQGVRETSEQVTARYGGVAQASLVVRWDENKLPVSIEALTGLEKPVYSHLNTYCMLIVNGLKDPRIRFSPLPGDPISVMPSDYPTGRPARFACVDANNSFRVVEATSAEKGPFKNLGSAPISRSDSLSLTFYDGDAAKITVTLDDFFAQLGTALSPTGGWGASVNAIEFDRDDPQNGSTVSVIFTLAGTSIGRGWDTVGHTAGTYRNRMRIEDPAPENPAPANPPADNLPPK
jgi:hypothetical protein